VRRKPSATRQPTVTFPAAEHMAVPRLYQIMLLGDREACVCEQLARGCYIAVERLESNSRPLKSGASNPPLSPLLVGDQPPISNTVKYTSLFTQQSDDPSAKKLVEITNRSPPHTFKNVGDCYHEPPRIDTPALSCTNAFN